MWPDNYLEFSSHLFQGLLFARYHVVVNRHVCLSLSDVCISQIAVCPVSHLDFFGNGVYVSVSVSLFSSMYVSGSVCLSLSVCL